MTSPTSSEQHLSADILGDVFDQGELQLPGGDLSERAEELAGGILDQPRVMPQKREPTFGLKPQKETRHFAPMK
ncbi:MAG: hypothetical protein KFB93_00100 [Simkaniaceae bacterium]|nr:MAG: hypothetical protein KFB93_00100 [Simkaniaceae bacterium]